MDSELIKLTERNFADREALAFALASAVADKLRSGIADRGEASLVVPGGSSPRRFLEMLGQQPLDWACVTITLTDERWVPPDDARSNEHLLRETLLRGAAAAACFVPLYAVAADPETGYAAIAQNAAKWTLPFDAVVLGMGLDGHCASLFPGGDHLADALSPRSATRVVPMRAPGADTPRMSLTLAALVATRALYLHIEGEAKRDVLVHARAGDPPFAQAPIRHVLQHAQVTPEVFWCS